MKVSIITVNYNNRDGLAATMRSVFSQTSKDYEYIIIDGGSSDGSKALIEDNSAHIAYWVSERDSGVYNAMNKAIDVATGEYCIFMNSGDVFHSKTVLSSFFNSNPSSDIVCGNTIVMDKAKTVKKAPESITMDTLFCSSICHQCAFIKTEVLKKYHYDDSLRIVADRKFFVQALILDNCSYQSIGVDVVDYDVNGLSARNRDASNQEYVSVLNQMIPQRILLDYGKGNFGALYGVSDYEKLFLEMKDRHYGRTIYSISVLLLKFISIFRRSAAFINEYPTRLSR